VKLQLDQFRKITFPDFALEAQLPSKQLLPGKDSEEISSTYHLQLPQVQIKEQTKRRTLLGLARGDDDSFS